MTATSPSWLPSSLRMTLTGWPLLYFTVMGAYPMADTMSSPLETLVDKVNLPSVSAMVPSREPFILMVALGMNSPSVSFTTPFMKNEPFIVLKVLI